ncbi:MAG TPA: CPBP family intramembrane glutamic endopeptidase [Kofleriaceae bacterium]|nr:CPBP family intramembrane glutamic endopeptidase [Kofleriaceae bacterium]
MSGNRTGGPPRPRRSAAARRPPAPRPGRRNGLQSPFGRGDLAVSLLLVFPLFLAYEVGVMFSPTVNGVDFVTRWVFAAVGYDRERFLLVHLIMALGFLGLLLHLRRKRTFQLRVFPPMLLESVLYAATMGTVIALLMERVLGLGVDPGGQLGLDPAELGESVRAQAVVMSLGAGVHEELVFRLGLMGGGAAALLLIGLGRGLSVGLALAVSAVLFSAAHHAGPLGEPFDNGVFVYRLLAGVVFGLIFYFRSLAHAVYTHFLYDLYVLLLRS